MKPRTKRRICGAVALAGFVLALGAVGGMERFSLGLAPGCAAAAAGMAMMWLAVHKGGWMR